MKYSHVFIDFDETMFNHHAYIDWADSALSVLLEREMGFYKNGFQNFHTQLEDPNLRLFQHEAHVQAATGKSWDYISGELQRMRKRLKHDFCYDDTHEFLDWLSTQDTDIRILTFGDNGYQLYKINICPKIMELQIPIHVVHESKREFLAREFSATERGILIDDKHPMKLPANWDEIWITRREIVDKPRFIAPKTYQVTTLLQIPKIII